MRHCIIIVVQPISQSDVARERARTVVGSRDVCGVGQCQLELTECGNMRRCGEMDALTLGVQKDLRMDIDIKSDHDLRFEQRYINYI